MTMELQTLGSVGIRLSDGTLSSALIVQPKRLGLLVYLAMAPRRRLRRRDQVVAMFWPELDQAHARGALSQGLRHLRRGLGDEVILSQGETEVGVDSSQLSCDAAALAAAVEAKDHATAARKYRGPFLDGFYIEGASQAFEEWVALERNRAREAAVLAMRSLAAELEGAGDLDGAVSWTRKATEAAPGSEAVTIDLIRLYARLGERGRALEEFERYQRYLEEAFGIEVSDAVDRVVSAVRAGRG